jgi:hypothetical protein
MVFVRVSPVRGGPAGPALPRTALQPSPQSPQLACSPKHPQARSYKSEEPVPVIRQLPAAAGSRLVAACPARRSRTAGAALGDSRRSARRRIAGLKGELAMN